ncbi:MAG TPA: HAMP domain-containing sensor histidine kinase [Miltoncostaeaceae bacterium]|nr:HAMP domain-containing sensor histidine kinase [Miltoncostaeaceae bacterium]
MIAEALAVAASTLAVGLAAAWLVRRLPTLRARVIGLALCAVLLPLGAVLVSGAVMFDSGHDLTVLAVATASATAALVGALLVARSVIGPVDRVRRASEELAGGDLGARAPEHGPGELAELGAAFNRMASELESLFDARRQLVAHASHDLRTPLASLQVMLEAIEDGLAPPERYLPAMHDQVRHLSRLVDDLFELARIDAGALTLELREVALGGLVEGCVRGVEARARARGVRLESRVAGGLPPVRGAPDQLERVLLNLITNALRHTPSDGAVAVLVQADGDEVRVSVEDTGDGIAPESLEAAFERFWRADSARRRDEGAGAGLGLAIARGLVEAQGGRIWAEARPQGGARVSFALPAAGTRA